MKITPGSIVADESEHVVLTGPITGTVTLSDGEVVDVSDAAVLARDELHAAEIAHAIGQHWADPANPNPPGLGDQPFEYDDSHYKAAVKAAKKG